MSSLQRLTKEQLIEQIETLEAQARPVVDKEALAIERCVRALNPLRTYGGASLYAHNNAEIRRILDYLELRYGVTRS